DNVIEYILSGDINNPGTYTVTYMWGKIDATNATMADILEALNANGSGVLGDKVWATATILVTEKTPETPSIPDNPTHSEDINKPETPQGTNEEPGNGITNELPNTEYNQNDLLAILGAILAMLASMGVGINIKHKKD
ncbi:hypothetical protein ACNQ2Q_26075, partial [Enterobacter cloacae complex sp.6701430]|uniref:hypothetical protein n=1 Tax=Enterobacter cloacae complex sp.6701430 TaxID=3397176 RepID=UPI003AAB9966